MNDHRYGQPVSLAAITLLGLGVLITLLGLLVAGNLVYTALGLTSIAVAGLLEIAGRRVSDRTQLDMDNQERNSR